MAGWGWQCRVYVWSNPVRQSYARPVTVWPPLVRGKPITDCVDPPLVRGQAITDWVVSLLFQNRVPAKIGWKFWNPLKHQRRRQVFSHFAGLPQEAQESLCNQPPLAMNFLRLGIQACSEDPALLFCYVCLLGVHVQLCMKQVFRESWVARLVGECIYLKCYSVYGRNIYNSFY